MACLNKIRSWTIAFLHLFSQETDFLIKVIIKCVNIKLWDILSCFHYILNAPCTLILTKLRLRLLRVHFLHKLDIFYIDLTSMSHQLRKSSIVLPQTLPLKSSKRQMAINNMPVETSRHHGSQTIAMNGITVDNIFYIKTF